MKSIDGESFNQHHDLQLKTSLKKIFLDILNVEKSNVVDFTQIIKDIFINKRTHSGRECYPETAQAIENLIYCCTGYEHEHNFILNSLQTSNWGNSIPHTTSIEQKIDIVQEISRELIMQEIEKINQELLNQPNQTWQKTIEKKHMKKITLLFPNT